LIEYLSFEYQELRYHFRLIIHFIVISLISRDFIKNFDIIATAIFGRNHAIRTIDLEKYITKEFPLCRVAAFFFEKIQNCSRRDLSSICDVKIRSEENGAQEWRSARVKQQTLLEIFNLLIRFD